MCNTKKKHIYKERILKFVFGLEVMKRNIIYLLIVILLKILCWLQTFIDWYQFGKLLLHNFVCFCYPKRVVRRVTEAITTTIIALFWYNQNDTKTMYSFRPFELVKVEYKFYKGLYDKAKGINSYPKPRSGHRIVCNDSDIYCFGGFNPDIIDGRRRTAFLFQELWKFDTFTKKWTLVYGPRADGMPEELASNAVYLKEDMIIVWPNYL